jgi:hypothetical protein
MRDHVFSKLPRYCLGLKPGLLWVRCPACRKPHREYFGPKDRDERNAEIVFLQKELEVAASILAAQRASARQRSGRGRSGTRRR